MMRLLSHVIPKRFPLLLRPAIRTLKEGHDVLFGAFNKLTQLCLGSLHWSVLGRLPGWSHASLVKVIVTDAPDVGAEHSVVSEADCYQVPRITETESIAILTHQWGSIDK
jgi:hypothetical protein